MAFIPKRKQGAKFGNECRNMLHRVSAAHFLLKKEALFSSPAVAVLAGSTVLLEKNPGCKLNGLRSSNLKNGAVINEREML